MLCSTLIYVILAIVMIRKDRDRELFRRLLFLAMYIIAHKCRYYDEFFNDLVDCVCIGMGFAAALILPVIVHGIYDTPCFLMSLSDTFSTLLLFAFILGFKYIRKVVYKITASMMRLDDITSKV